MLIRCEILKKLANAFIEVAKEENLPVNIQWAGLIQTPAVPNLNQPFYVNHLA